MAQLIPRVIHRLWLGNDQIPDIFEQYAETWRRHHPEWEMKLWRDDNLPEISCQAELDRAKSFKSRYDILRMELLRQNGGVIIDMDVEVLRPIDPLLDGVEAFVGRATFANRMGNQVLGAVPSHPLWEHAIKRLRDTAGIASSASQEAGPAFVSRMVQEKPKRVTVFPRDTFFSPLTIEPPQYPEKYPLIYAVHHSTESYRDGEDSEVIRLQRRLRDAQKEILRLMGDELADPEAEASADGGATRTVFAPEYLAKELRSARADLELVTCSRWWKLGHRLGIVKFR